MLKCFSKKKSSSTKNYCSKCGTPRQGKSEISQMEDHRDGLLCGKHAKSKLDDSEQSPCYKKTTDQSLPTTTTDITIRTRSRNDRKENFSCYGTDLPTMAYMPVSRDNPYYNMNHPRRGKAVTFNFDRWDNTTIPDLGLSPRLGSEKDKQDLVKTLKRLEFEVEQYDNCGNLEMWAILDRLKSEDHSSADCLLIGIMTHGEKNTVYVKDGTQIPVNLIWENFEAHNCPTLAGKPKIFIVQACRGKKYDSGTILTSNRATISADKFTDVTDSGAFSYVIPNAADIIVAFSCPLGHYSWRNPEKGSWFIQSICNVFDKYAYELDLQGLLTTVAREVALNYSSNTSEWESNKKKQVTSTSSTLIRIVKFRPKNQSNHYENGNGNIVQLEIQSPQEQPNISRISNGFTTQSMEIEVQDSNTLASSVKQIDINVTDNGDEAGKSKTKSDSNETHLISSENIQPIHSDLEITEENLNPVNTKL